MRSNIISGKVGFKDTEMKSSNARRELFFSLIEKEPVHLGMFAQKFEVI